jgi:hypothetical protein
LLKLFWALPTLFLPKDTLVEFPIDFEPFAIVIYFTNKYFIIDIMELVENNFQFDGYSGK